MNANNCLKTRDLHPRGSEKWRELNRAALILQSNGQVVSIAKQLSKIPQWSAKSDGEREDYARNRVANVLADMSRAKEESWLQRDIMSVRDTIKTVWGD